MEVCWRGARRTLSAADFLAEGGQAKVYAQGTKALKIFTSAPPPVPKLEALRALAQPGIIVPEEWVHGTDGSLIGFSMTLLDGWRPLVQLFPRPYRDRNGLDVDAIGALVLQLRDLVRHAHRHSALVVDLNELNVLVSPDYRQVALIDVDSWQLPHFPASALAPSVQDHRSRGFSEGTDWYAFAVLAFQLFSGIHPYRGRHTVHKTLEARMKRCLSVFHPEVLVPPMAELQTPWRPWFERIFAQGERSAPPVDLTAVAPTPLTAPTQAKTEERVTLGAPILGTASWGGRSWLWTQEGVYQGRRRIGPAPSRGARALRGREGPLFLDELPTPGAVAHRGRLWGRVGGQIVEYTPRTFGGSTQLSPRVAATVPPHATRLFRGVAVAAVLGTAWLIRLDAGSAVQERAPELDGLRVVDAVHEAGVTVVITQASSGWERHVFGPDGHRSTPTPHPAAELLVLPTGLGILTTETGLELFASSRPGGAVRAVDLDLPAPLQLLDGRPGYVDGCTFVGISLA